MSKETDKWDVPQWLHVLENRHKVEIHLGLNRILEIAKKLDIHAPECKVITVGGTNGKGSTVAALEQIYHCAGYKVGAYTSPHLLTYNERIRLNLVPIPDDYLCKAFSRIEEARGSMMLSYFETTTLAALLYFKQQQVDLMILEVGLGGRLDATNIIDNDLAIITTIDYDHEEFLGNSLEAIAFEKSGILRRGKLFVYADVNPPSSIVEQAEHKQVHAHWYQNDYSFIEQGETWDFMGLNHSITQIPVPKIQLKSASCAIAASILMHDALPVTEDAIKLAMHNVFVPGRLDLHSGSVNILYDVSHNPQSARLLADTVRQLDCKGRVHAVFSGLKDKDIFGLIIPLKDCVDHWYPTQLDSKRSASSELLLAQLRKAEIVTEICYTSPLVAFETALGKAKDGDLIVVYGSFYTVSQVMSAQHTPL